MPLYVPDTVTVWPDFAAWMVATMGLLALATAPAPISVASDSDKPRFLLFNMLVVVVVLLWLFLTLPHGQNKGSRPGNWPHSSGSSGFPKPEWLRSGRIPLLKRSIKSC